MKFQEAQKKCQKAYNIQESVTDIGVEQIVARVDNQYLKEINKEYFRYPKITIKEVLGHLRATWCKITTRDKTDAKAALLQPWTPPTHIITYGRYLDKHHNIGKAIGTPILDTDKILKFVVQIYVSEYFMEEHMMVYKCQPNKKNDDWHENLKYFTNLYAPRKAYSKD